jgi:uncharacterized protein YecT (DUF1311 family)
MLTAITNKKNCTMKQLRLTFFLFFISQFCFSQSPEEITDTEMESLKVQIQNETIKLKQKLESRDYLSDFDKEVSINFQCDTFKIERLLALRIEIDYSTSGMVQAIYDAEVEYDKLLNKYYQLLVKKLNDADKEILKQSQRNWIQFRDSERNFNNEISKDEYSGGGTMQRIIVSSGYLEITKKRVFELYSYLTRFYE